MTPTVECILIVLCFLCLLHAAIVIPHPSVSPTCWQQKINSSDCEYTKTGKAAPQAPFREAMCLRKTINSKVKYMSMAEALALLSDAVIIYCNWISARDHYANVPHVFTPVIQYFSLKSTNVGWDGVFFHAPVVTIRFQRAFGRRNIKT